MKYALTTGTYMLAVVGHQRLVGLIPSTAGVPDRGRPVLFEDRTSALEWCRANPEPHMRPTPWNPQPLALLHA